MNNIAASLFGTSSPATDKVRKENTRYKGCMEDSAITNGSVWT